MIERTLAIIKPDAVERKLVGKIISCYEEEGFRMVAMRRERLTIDDAGDFYMEHKGKPFYESLVNYMSSGPVILMVLEGENAIQKNREVMGATNPAQAAPGTIRKAYGLSIEKNSVHGSDSPSSAAREIEFFFPGHRTCL